MPVNYECSKTILAYLKQNPHKIAISDDELFSLCLPLSKSTITDSVFHLRDTENLKVVTKTNFEDSSITFFVKNPYHA